MDNKRKIACALEAIADASAYRKSEGFMEDKGLQWAAELLKALLDKSNKKCGYCGNRRGGNND